MLLEPSELRQIEDVDVYLEEGGDIRETDLRTVRDRFYGFVDECIENQDYGGSAMHSGSMGRSNNEDKSSKADDDYDDWLESLEDVTAEMDIKTPTGVKTVELVPRTDFRFDQVQTAPNIMKGRYDGSTTLAVREWSHYLDVGENGPDAVETALDAHGWSYSRGSQDSFAVEGRNPGSGEESSYELGPTDILSRLAAHGKHFNRNSHDDDLYRSMGTSSYDPGDFEGGITMIPELLLNSAFHKEDGVNEQIMNNELASPVFPYNVVIADMYDDMAFAIRPWWDKSMDGGLYGEADENQMAALYGTLEGLNLVTCFDREDEFADERIPGRETAKVFFDPEFVGYTDKPRWFIGSDWADFAEQLNEHGKVGDSALERIKERKNRVSDSFNGRIDILDEIPTSVDRDLFPREKIVETRV